MFVHTAHGPGRVVEEQTVRGRKSFLVEGSGFKLWVDERDLRVANDVNEDNSSHLPYDPTPQYPTEMFNSESTIQPGEQEIDPDERLNDSDSLSFNHVEDYPYPNPSPDNFAKEGGFDGAHDSGFLRKPPKGYRGKHRPEPAPEFMLPGEVGVWDSEDWLDAHPGPSFSDPREQARYDEWLNKLAPAEFGDKGLHSYEPIYSSRSDKEFSFPEDDFEHEGQEEPLIKHFSYRQAAGMADFATDAVDSIEDAAGDEEDPTKPKKGKGKGLSPNGLIDKVLPADMASHINDDQWYPGHFPGRSAGLYDRPAGLSDKYVRVEARVDHYSDPVQQFRDDPVGFIQKRAYMMGDSVDIRLAEYVDLVESDSSIRTAAWKDVRSKALRLRREGRVHVMDIGPQQIYASVDGDSDTYETMIAKMGNNQSISDWHCSCQWGRWAHKRQMSYVGRLCSHGYAAYLEMESQHMKNPQKYRRSAGVVEDFKEYAENQNNGHIDQPAMDNFVALCNSVDEDHEALDHDQVEELYDALDGLKSKGKVRDYNVGYEPNPTNVYKEADALRLRPHSLTPDFTFIEDGDSESWVDVTKDERKTTGPDNMVKKSRRLTGRELHYASDEELGHAVKDWADSAGDLEKLRELSDEDPDYGHRRDQTYEIRQVVDELHDRGIDASQFVASLRFADDANADLAEDDKEKQPSMTGAPNQTGQPGGSGNKPEDAPKAAEQPNNPTGQNVPSSQRPQTGVNNDNGGGFDPASVMSGLGQAAGGLVNILPDMIRSIPPVVNSIGQYGTGLASGIGSLTNALSGIGGLIHGSTHEGMYPNIQLTNQESFQGSGPDPKYWIGSSECYVDDHERERFQSLTDLDDDPLVQFVDKNPKQGPKKASRSRRPFVASEEDNRDNLLQAEGDEIHTLGEYHEFLDEARESGDDYAAALFEEAIQDEEDHARNFGEGVDRLGSENANPQGSTLTSGGEIDQSGVQNFDSAYKAGAATKRPWDGHRVKDFRKFVRQQGGRPTHQMLQEYLSKPRRGLDQGGTQHLQDYTSYAEQHEASLRYADDMTNTSMDPAAADVVGNMSPNPSPEMHGILASAGDDSDIVAAFHRMGGIEAINNSGGGGSYSDAAIAEQAKGFLRTAGRVYSLAEQRELENESHPKGARNLKDLDLKGTHYEDVL